MSSFKQSGESQWRVVMCNVAGKHCVNMRAHASQPQLPKKSVSVSVCVYVPAELSLVHPLLPQYVNNS